MISDLAERVAAAEAGGDDPTYAAFRAIASDSVCRAAWVAATALVADVATIADVMSDLWPDSEDHEKAVVELIAWPFVEQTADGYRIGDASSDAFRWAFLEADSVAFRAAHQAFADRESAREAVDDPEETWFVRGRLAYYLAGFDTAAAVETFGAEFAAPPALDRTDARMWLSWLAVRQERLLADRQREVSFFRGFRAYVLGRGGEARLAFDAVIGSGATDVYEALGSHFAGLLRRRDAPDEGIMLLRGSVELSKDLKLVENEVMARNSLVAALIARGSSDDLIEGDRLAELQLGGRGEHARPVSGLVVRRDPGERSMGAVIEQTRACHLRGKATGSGLGVRTWSGGRSSDPR